MRNYRTLSRPSACASAEAQLRFTLQAATKASVPEWVRESIMAHALFGLFRTHGEPLASGLWARLDTKYAEARGSW